MEFAIANRSCWKLRVENLTSVWVASWADRVRRVIVPGGRIDPSCRGTGEVELMLVVSGDSVRQKVKMRA